MESSEVTDKSVMDPQPHSKKMKWLTTIAILFTNLTFGCNFNFFSPALEDLKNKFDTDIDSVSLVFTVSLICYCIGALLSGVIIRYMNKQLFVVIAVCGMALTLFLTPHCTSQTQFLVLGGLQGLSGGTYDCTQILWMVEIWQEKSGPFIQAQNFVWALGANIPPLLLGPFLSDGEDEDDVTTTTMSSAYYRKNFTTFAEDEKVSGYSSNMWIPFTIGGAFNAMAVAYQLFLFIFYRYYIPPLYVESNDVSMNNGITDKESISTPKELQQSEKQLNGTQEGELEKEGMFENINWDKVKLIALIGIFLGGYQALELCTLQFIPTFGQYSDLMLSESDASYVLTGLTATFATGRFLGMFIIMKIPPVALLFVNLSIILVGNTILLIWAPTSITMFWVACAILGAGFSTVYPSFTFFIENNLIFTSYISAFMIVCGSTISAIYPVIIGHWIKDRAVILSYTNYFSLFVCTLALATAFLLTRKNKNRYV